MSMLLFSIFGAFESITGIETIKYGSILAIIYTGWAIGLFFDGNKILNILKSFFAYIFGMLLFFLFFFPVAILIERLS